MMKKTLKGLSPRCNNNDIRKSSPRPVEAAQLVTQVPKYVFTSMQ